MSELMTVRESPRIHELKTLPHYFRCVAAGLKSFEVRLDDRNFCVGDLLRLQEFEPVVGYTGRIVEKTIGYILSGGQFGIERGYVVLGFCESTEFSRLRVQERRADELAKQIERTDGLLKRFMAFVAEHIDEGRWAGYDIYTAVITEWIERDQKVEAQETQLKQIRKWMVEAQCMLSSALRSGDPTGMHCTTHAVRDNLRSAIAYINNPPQAATGSEVQP